MDALKSWGITLCLAVLAAGIAGIIAPSGKMEKVFKFAVSLFFLCCVLVPLFNIKSIHLDKIEINQFGVSYNSAINATVNEEAARIAQQNVEQLIKNSCKTCGVEPEAVNVKIAANPASGEINVVSAEIVLKKRDMAKSSKISDTVMRSLGITVNIREGEK
jgi:hypothetical protein